MAPKSTPKQPATAALFRRRLLAWFRRHGRNLPWRHTRNPYRILVSEVMLQQTQVSRVSEYYPRFLKRFPSLPSLAGASAGSVREAWDGLGYYRRAANLHRLPGVGRYTAGAVASFAFELPVPAVDTNVARVLRRAFHPRLPGGARGVHRLWETAEAILPRDGAAAWGFNQAVMELGALVCTARVARCGECPVAGACATGSRRLAQ